MGNQKKLLFFVIVIILITALFMGCSSTDIGENPQHIELQSQKDQQTSPSFSSEGEMKVHFIDVGQGDATLVQTPNNKTILIDAGDREWGSKVADYIESQGINTIDVVIATHPHADHIGGMADVIDSLNVEQIYMPKVSHTSKTFEDLLVTIQKKGLKVKTAKAGVVFDIDPSIEVLMIAPNSGKYENFNDYSVVLKIVYGNSSFIITGDAEETSEKEMLSKGYDVKADVLRVSHHGSRSSTTQQFLNAVDPKYAIISVGAHNKYGHPHDEILARLSNAAIDIYRTDTQGLIVITTNGQFYDINVNKKGSPNPNPNPSSISNADSTPIADPASIPTEKIDINSASLEELQDIIHIGAEYADQIIDLRPFKSIDELTKVNGIGDARLRDIIDEGKAFVKEEENEGSY
ncbi:Metal-dependent hydrolase, beta-lactamase superfamily II [Anaerovirgula multivorans]|uniref:Metal-dependent hydrolase, beta-lactamase superfamily II n=1 Tax=Anaerovirgula multivorans TaxID=312168 RepID=A0A239HXQ3_9FIRM|nr:MBL fold metallo-hydrolase [Anaerovirgula multivorans]SNS86022.1 Metal-dependent hydrolase, beta-lactamase superfamily II [Anaerovirgula multivorans]